MTMSVPGGRADPSEITRQPQGGDVPSEETATDRHGTPDRAALLALGEGVRTLLRLHQQMGISHYPLTPGLGTFVRAKQARPNEQKKRMRPPAPTAAPVGKKTAPAATATAGQPPPTESDRLSVLRRDIEVCRLCPLAADRWGVVFAAGTAPARLLVIGGHSRQEGEYSPTILFGGQEDVMLWNMMRAIGLGSGDIVVTNAIKCCPKADLPPESLHACTVHLRREIALVQPRVILAMGEEAAHAVLGTGEPISRLRGRFHAARQDDANGVPIPVMVTFHPRFLLAQPAMKQAAWQDLQMIQRRLSTDVQEEGTGRT
ncbi:Uracil-DNA glycosylase superfamily [Desulfobulbus propionicus DSM 2032]|jgi:DNA polymerase|uniref:Uracil-DNA glycosylase superfamily n=2 Tax=Desulfobulbus propionicus TaxID=894 RepID=A0A7U3YPC1_DESPD|nr:Uracil-DNA glycosylase superfamily [Desulfobulbus propionicus DSM 2032]